MPSVGCFAFNHQNANTGLSEKEPPGHPEAGTESQVGADQSWMPLSSPVLKRRPDKRGEGMTQVTQQDQGLDLLPSSPELPPSLTDTAASFRYSKGDSPRGSKPRTAPRTPTSVGRLAGEECLLSSQCTCCTDDSQTQPGGLSCLGWARRPGSSVGSTPCGELPV